MSNEEQAEGTDFKTKCEILAELWLNERDNEDFDDFIEYNDLGLPLAYCISSGIVEETDRARGFIEEAWALLLGSLGIDEGEEFESLDEVLAAGLEFDFEGDFEDEEEEDEE
jgi:hypothetical protein